MPCPRSPRLAAAPTGRTHHQRPLVLAPRDADGATGDARPTGVGNLACTVDVNHGGGPESPGSLRAQTDVGSPIFIRAKRGTRPFHYNTDKTAWPRVEGRGPRGPRRTNRGSALHKWQSLPQTLLSLNPAICRLRPRQSGRFPSVGHSLTERYEREAEIDRAVVDVLKGILPVCAPAAARSGPRFADE